MSLALLLSAVRRHAITFGRAVLMARGDGLAERAQLGDKTSVYTTFQAPRKKPQDCSRRLELLGLFEVERVWEGVPCAQTRG